MPHKTYDTAYIPNEEPPPPNDPKGYRGAAPRQIIPQQPALMIVGDMQWPQDAGPHVHRYIGNIVERAKTQDMRLITDDAPKGVAASALIAAQKHTVDTTVYGVDATPRNPAAKQHAGRYVQVMREHIEDEETRSPRLATVAERNHDMLSGAERVLVIWNGQTQSTQDHYQAAVEAGKAADLVAYRDGRMQVVDSHRPEIQPATPEHNDDTPPPPSESPSVAIATDGQPVYTLGYAGVEIETVQNMVEALDATLVDIRLAGRSRKRGFNKKALREAFGENYLHLPQLGNVNYNDRDKPIELKDFAGGLEAIRAQAPDKPLVLMCGCKSVHTCHRQTVADKLQQEGYTYHGEALDVVQDREQNHVEPDPPSEPMLDEAELRKAATEAPTQADVPDDDLSPEVEFYRPHADLVQLDLDAQFDLACEWSDLPPVQLEQALATTLNFHATAWDALAAVGVQPTEPNLAPPPYYDARQDMALWVGVVAEQADQGTTCLLAMEGATSDKPQAYLSPCYHGERGTAERNSHALLETLHDSQDVSRLLGVAEGMARANGLHHLWSRSDGLPLEDSVSDALAKHLQNEQELEL